jgi:perosamine synthetase
MSSPDLTEVEIAAVTQVLRTPYLSIGPQIESFERLLASYIGTAYAVGVNSGTSGLHLCVIAAGVEEGDEVITTPFSFVSSANCILFERARPVFVDITPDTLCLDPARIEEAITPRTKAILAVDVFGQPADHDPIREIADRHNLLVIEDACEAIGAEYKGRKAGTLGDAAVFAFYPNKQMTTGEGGMIVTDDEEWAHLFRSLRNQGRDVFDGWLNHTRLGYNYRLDELSAAMGVAQLGRIEELLVKREQVASWYNERLVGVEGVRIPYIAPTTTRMSWFVYVVRLQPPLDRDRVLAALKARDIPSRPYFTPIHLQPFYREKFGYRRGDFPEAEAAGDSCLALPFSSVMTEEQMDYVCSTLEEIV